MTDKSYLLRFGYAPGEYGHGKCADCDQKFFGDKYARRCEACAETLYSQVSSVEAVADKHRAMTTVSEEAVRVAMETYLAGNGETVEADFRNALTAALPHLPGVGVKVKPLEWELASGDHYAEGAGTHYNIYQTKPDLWNSVTVRPGNVRLATNVDLEAAKAAAQADYEARILSALEPSSARELALENVHLWQVATEDEASVGWTYLMSDIEQVRDQASLDCGYDATLEFTEAVMKIAETRFRALSSPDHADAAPERAWYFKSGGTVPEWLEKIEKGNCTLTFGVDVVVTSKDGGYEVRPQGIADNAGPILHVVNHGNVTPEIKGGGNGVAIIGYNRPYDETAEWRVARLKRLLEIARPYVECYDTREHNSEQDAVLTEIDKALSVVVAGTNADAGKVEGDGWLPIETKDGNKFSDDYIDQLNALCEDFGCEPGSDRLKWLRDKLSTLNSMVSFIGKATGYLEYLPVLLEAGQMSGHAGNCTILAKEGRNALRGTRPLPSAPSQEVA